MTEQSSNNIRVAFVDVFVFEDGSVRGGALVTDTLSRPFEFRVTSPVKPTQLQKILYGRSLVEYMYGELIGLPLLKQLKETVSLAICKNPYLLVARPDISFPMIAIKKTEQEPGENIIDTSIIQTHKNFESEHGQAEVLLNMLASQFDIFEPFERVRVAVSEVNKQKAN